jgi:hypothetical protein
MFIARRPQPHHQFWSISTGADFFFLVMERMMNFVAKLVAKLNTLFLISPIAWRQSTHSRPL